MSKEIDELTTLAARLTKGLDAARQRILLQQETLDEVAEIVDFNIGDISLENNSTETPWKIKLVKLLIATGYIEK